MTATQITDRSGETLESPSASPTQSNPSTSGDRAHSTLRRTIERFALIAFGLYHIPLFINNYPSLGGGGFNDTGLAAQWGRVFTKPSIWVARHVFGIAAPSGSNGDNGDVSEEYARLLISVVIGVVGAMIWTIADRRRRSRGEWVESTLRVLLRYSIALGLMSYGIAKIFPQQFPPIAVPTLDRRVGDLTPMSLLWTFMQYSRGYAFFGGVMELVAVVLLCFRRTALLGALVCLAVMTNVTLLNYAYGVPVKLYSTMITLSAAVLVLYDARRLYDFFLRDRAVSEPRESTLLQDRVPRVCRRTIKLVAVGSVALSSVAAMKRTLNPPAPQSALEGAWDVIPTSAPNGWRKLNIGGTSVRVRTAGDSSFRCGLGPSVAWPAVSLQCGREHGGEFRWTRVRDTLRMEGTFEKLPLNVTATYVDRASYPLMRSRFRWMFD